MMEAIDLVKGTVQTEWTYKPRRKRTVIPAKELERLEKLFSENNWPNRQQKQSLAADLGRSKQFVNIWFQNKRARVKKHLEQVAIQDGTVDRKTPTAQRSLLCVSGGCLAHQKRKKAVQSGSDSKIHPHQQKYQGIFQLSLFISFTETLY